MASQIIEGRIEPTAPDRITRSYGYYKSLIIHQPGGVGRSFRRCRRDRLEAERAFHAA